MVSEMTLSSAHSNMIQQVRAWNVSDPCILDLLASIPREPFVPKSYQRLAYSDAFIPLGHNQVMLPPKIIARMLQALTLNKYESILEIGTGTGYTAALLAKTGAEVTTLEILPPLAKIASKHSRELNLNNLSVVTANGFHGWTKEAPFDVIVLSGSVPFIPTILGKQLKPHGRLFAIVGKPPVMYATLVTKLEDERFHKKILFETQVPPLIGLPKVNQFEF